MPSNRLEIEDVPELPGYLTVAAVAEMYQIHKGTVYYMIFKSRRFRTVFKVTKGMSSQGEKDKRPLLLLDEREVKQVFAQKAEDATLNGSTDPQLKAKLTAWNKRVKQWGRDNGWTETPIAISGPPQIQLIEAYLKAHPEDRKPRPDGA